MSSPEPSSPQPPDRDEHFAGLDYDELFAEIAANFDDPKEAKAQIMPPRELAAIALRSTDVIMPEEFEGYLTNHAASMARRSGLDYDQTLALTREAVRLAMFAIGPAFLEGQTEIEPYALVDKAPVVTNRDQQLRDMIEARVRLYGLEAEPLEETKVSQLAELICSEQVMSAEVFGMMLKEAIDEHISLLPAGFNRDRAARGCIKRLKHMVRHLSPDRYERILLPYLESAGGKNQG